MFCPNCGNKISLEQKFCRSCGLGLEKVAQTLAEQLPLKLDESLEQRKNKLERLGVAALSTFGLGVLGVFLYSLAHKLLVQGKVLAALGLLAAIIILGCGVLSVILFAKAKDVEEEAKKRRIQPGLKPTDVTGKLLPDMQVDAVPSVAEGTTELLLTEKPLGAKRA